MKHARCGLRMSGRFAKLLVVLTVILFSTAPELLALDYESAARLLVQAGDFRVRVNAALILGRSGRLDASRHLEASLAKDSHPAVRASAAAALAALGSRGSLPALQRARKDASPAVRAQVARSLKILSRPPEPASNTGRPGLSLHGVDHLVMLGEMNDRSGAGDGRIAGLLRTELVRHLRGMSGVAVIADVTTLDAAVEKQVRRHKIVRLRIDGAVIKADRDVRGAEMSSSCAVSLMVMEDPDMIIRAVLKGSATSTGMISRQKGEREKRALLDKALRRAVSSALSNFESVMTRTGAETRRARREEVRGRDLRSSVALAGPVAR